MPVIQIVAWVGILQALQSINVDILMARDRTRTLFRYAIFFCSAHVLAFVIGLQWGITGVAAAYAISSTFVEPVLTVLTARALGVSPWVPVRSIAGVVQAAAIMAVAAGHAGLPGVGGRAGGPRLLLASASWARSSTARPACWREPELKRELRTVASHASGPRSRCPARSRRAVR